MRGKPASAYAIDKTLREHSPLYRSFKRGNLYTFVERLAKLGLVERDRAASQRGPRKTKTLYRLSPKGERRFMELLRGVLIDVQANDAALETALVLLGQLRRDRAVELLRERASNLAAHERRLARLLGDMHARAGGAYLMVLHTLHRLRGERRYLSDTLDLLRNARWKPEWA